jgi:hypothetical protein
MFKTIYIILSILGILYGILEYLTGQIFFINIVLALIISFLYYFMLDFIESSVDKIIKKVNLYNLLQ